MSEGRHQQSGLSLTEAADTLGCSVELLQTLWQALGFTKESSHTATWTADEIAATALFLAARDTLDQDALIAAARVMGQSMARLAEWEAEQVLAMRNELQIDIPAGDIVAAIGLSLIHI